MWWRRRRTVEPEVVAAQESDWPGHDWRPFAPDEASGAELERGRLRQVVHEACDRERAREDGERT